MLQRLYLYLSILILVSPLVWAGEILEGKVVRILDGDSIEVLVDKTPVRVWLDLVDCPENSQAFGKQAKQFTSDFILGKQVKVRIDTKGKSKVYIADEKGRYRRVIGTVFFADGRILNEELLKVGLAWHNKLKSNDTHLVKIEAVARAAKLGLWFDSDPVPPWKFRAKKKAQ